ncbi:MAG: M48 family metalloprotease [Candidatus Sericytochromatia bacterium]|nr:M48 family metalloprotease [Candidatus Sericytochromatia bacterium]
MRNRLVWGLFLLGAWQALVACDAQNVAAGGALAAQALTITAADERRMGEQTKQQVLQDTPRLEQEALQTYLAELGTAIVSTSEPSGRAFEWHVVVSDEVNAFAAPGGFVFVTTGALKLMQNEAQLVGVLGHEVAHVVRSHSLQGIRQALLAQGVVTGVLGAEPDKLAELGAKVASSLILKHNDRAFELESDLWGADAAHALGYDPRELAAFLLILSRQAGEPPKWASWFFDHPGTPERIAALEAHVASRGWNLSATRQDAARFRARIAGL